MQITFNIPDTIAPRFVDAFCIHYGYSSTIAQEDGTSIPNPQTRAQFTKATIKAMLLDIVRTHEANIAQQQARSQAMNTANQEIIIT